MKNSLLTIKQFSFLTLILFWANILEAQTTVNRIEIIKHQRNMNLIRDDKTVKTYKISLGTNPKGRKQEEGDKKTPEGKYFIRGKNPSSRFHLALEISYPNPEDTSQAIKRGKNPGNNIMIHGLPNYLSFVPAFVQRAQRWIDWTLGCIAVTNGEIEEIFRDVEVGTPVIISP